MVCIYLLGKGDIPNIHTSNVMDISFFPALLRQKLHPLEALQYLVSFNRVLKKLELEQVETHQETDMTYTLKHNSE